MEYKNLFLGIFIVVLQLYNVAVLGAMYEDQIKKFDWRVKYIGSIERAHLELNAFQPFLIVSTRENVVASICPKTGELLWRQVLESGPRGQLKLMQAKDVSYFGSEEDSSNAPARLNFKSDFDVLTVQGHAPALVRAWNANTGNLEWEWSFMPSQIENAEAAQWFYLEGVLFHVLPVWKSHLEISRYFPKTGQASGSTTKIIAPWISAETCVRAGGYYVCHDKNQLISLDLLTLSGQPQILKKTLAAAPRDPIRSLEGATGIVIIDRHLISIRDDVKTCSNLESNDFKLGMYNQRRILILTDIKDNMLQMQGYSLETCLAIEELSQSMTYPEHYGVPRLSTFDCKMKRVNDGKGCLFLLDTADEALVAIQQSRVRWAREEALANVVGTEFIDLPLTDTEGALENEIKGKQADIVSAFVRRVTAQISQFKSIFLHVVGLGPPPSDTQKAGLVRDSFGLHKMLVVLTRSGKILGIDNISGKHHWQQYLPEVENFENEQPMRLIIQRTAKHFPLQALCTIVARDKNTKNGVIFRFNPITGNPSEGGLLRLDYKIKQLSVLAETENDFVKGIMVMDTAQNLKVYPETAIKMANDMYIFTADMKTATLEGFHVKLTENNQLKLTALWNARFCAPICRERIIAIATKNPIERVHSQGRVLGDRSVLYKYINPNLVAVFTEENDAVHKYIINVHLIDVVSGMVIFSMAHRKVRPPLNVVHSENWLAYSYFNDKTRRTEITTIELYEGKTQANNSVWSSLNAPPMPLIERQSYIMPTIIETLQETITERGITNKHVLIGTTSGNILEMPWALLDPRRPTASTTQGREEGAIPYIPELPIPTENMINYNQTIARLKNIYTAPSGLESTCLVVATGLDMFVTRVAPSKTFDLLKEDFDYILISSVLVALISGSLIVKHLSSRKALKQAWK